MKKKYLKIILIIAISIICLVINMPKTLATGTISPTDITGQVGDGEELKIDSVEDLIDMLQIIGTFVAVGVLMVIGIRYMAGSAEEKASYKKSMMPYVIGCFLLFGASILGPKIVELFKDVDTTETAANRILGLLQIVGSFVAVGGLMILGIKYMTGSAEERASYKKSMIPYVIGAVLLFGAVNLTTFIYNMTQEAVDAVEGEDPAYQSRLDGADNEGRASGQRAGRDYYINSDRAGYEAELKRLKENLEKAKEDGNKVLTKKYEAQIDGLMEGWTKAESGF